MMRVALSKKLKQAIGSLDGSLLEEILDSINIDNFEITEGVISIPLSQVKDVSLLQENLKKISTSSGREFAVSVKENMAIIPINKYRTSYTSNFQIGNRSTLQATELDFSETELKNEIIKLYKLFDDLISKKLAELRHSNKKLLIIVGENHFGRKSLLVELVLIKLAEKYGIKNLVTETSQELLAKIRSITPAINYPNLSFLIPVVDNQGIKAISADPDCKKSDSIREKNIKLALGELNEDAIFISGVNHLLTFTTDNEINSKFEFLSINAVNLTEQESKEFKSLSKDLSSARVLFGLVEEPPQMPNFNLGLF